MGLGQCRELTSDPQAAGGGGGGLGGGEKDWGWREKLDGERSPRLTAPLTKPHLLVLPKIVPPTRDQALKYMTVWVHSHSNYHTI